MPFARRWAWVGVLALPMLVSAVVGAAVVMWNDVSRLPTEVLFPLTNCFRWGWAVQLFAAAMAVTIGWHTITDAKKRRFQQAVCVLSVPVGWVGITAFGIGINIGTL